jgi:hypothetical protein
MSTELEKYVLEAFGEVASLFMSQPTKGTQIEMPSRELQDIASKLVPKIQGLYEQPFLGYATTRELLAEISARIETRSGGLDYSTVKGDSHDLQIPNH